MDDLYDEGFGAGLMGCDWLSTVAGRFLRQWQRAPLAAGWQAGLAELDRMEADHERHESNEAAIEWERIGPVGGDEIPW